MGDVKFNFLAKKFIVTGASSGMGHQITLELLEAGAIVLGIARNRDKLEELKLTFPDNFQVGICDVCDKEALQVIINSFVESKGKIDGAVHAAGIDGMTPLKVYDVELARKIVETSFWAGIDLLQIATKNKICKVGASFVMFSSVAAYKGEKAMFAYSAAKAALQASVKTIAKEIASKGNRVNTISPGRVLTPMTKENPNEDIVSRHLLGEGKAEDVSGMALFLLSDRARWITSTDFVVDGGYLAN